MRRRSLCRNEQILVVKGVYLDIFTVSDKDVIFKIIKIVLSRCFVMYYLMQRLFNVLFLLNF